LKRSIAKDAVVTYDDVVLPAGRLADQLRAEQYHKFRGETWLKDLLTTPQITDQAGQVAVSAWLTDDMALDHPGAAASSSVHPEHLGCRFNFVGSEIDPK
jgi:hypothetical protein